MPFAASSLADSLQRRQKREGGEHERSPATDPRAVRDAVTPPRSQTVGRVRWAGAARGSPQAQPSVRLVRTNPARDRHGDDRRGDGPAPHTHAEEGTGRTGTPDGSRSGGGWRVGSG